MVNSLVLYPNTKTSWLSYAHSLRLKIRESLLKIDGPFSSASHTSSSHLSPAFLKAARPGGFFNSWRCADELGCSRKIKDAKNKMEKKMRPSEAP